MQTSIDWQFPKLNKGCAVNTKAPPWSHRKGEKDYRLGTGGTRMLFILRPSGADENDADERSRCTIKGTRTIEELGQN